MGIMLQSSVGPFDESFLIRIPQLERMMMLQGLDPSRFVIAKDRSLSTNARPFGSRLWDYTVFVDGDHFTVTKPNDASFLGYFVARCLAPDDHAAMPPWPGGLLSRVLRWMAQPI
ncbi:MAG: hypothetical protein P4M07_21700 [Xanthobacteraceae bacterium]|nr:hypothetical protein [Xanthobacteraceae bacterium]